MFKIGKPHHRHAPRMGDEKQVANAIRSVVTAFHQLEPGKPLWITELGFPVANPGNTGEVPVVTNSVQKML
jgi:hypothetical protein